MICYFWRSFYLPDRTIPCSTKIESAGGSASIRVVLPPLDIEFDLEQQKENCITAILRGKELLKFFNDVRCNGVKEPIHPGEFLAEPVLAPGAVFSALEVVPLALIGFEAHDHWRAERHALYCSWSFSYDLNCRQSGNP